MPFGRSWGLPPRLWPGIFIGLAPKPHMLRDRDESAAIWLAFYRSARTCSSSAMCSMTSNAATTSNSSTYGMCLSSICTSSACGIRLAAWPRPANKYLAANDPGVGEGGSDAGQHVAGAVSHFEKIAHGRKILPKSPDSKLVARFEPEVRSLVSGEMGERPLLESTAGVAELRGPSAEAINDPDGKAAVRALAISATAYRMDTGLFGGALGMSGFENEEIESDKQVAGNNHAGCRLDQLMG